MSKKDIRKEPRMAETYNNIVVKSTLSTILNLIESYKKTALCMQKSIIELDWQKVYAYAYEQNGLNDFFEKILKNISKSNNIESKETLKLKSSIKKEISNFKDIQRQNNKLLKDSLYTAKLKVKKIFNNPNNDNYSKEMKIENNLWNNHAVIFDKLA